MALSQEVTAFCRKYARDMAEGTVAIFGGAGMSAAVGFVDWATLLAPFGSELGLNVDREGDHLVRLAQYSQNYKGGNRAHLNEALITAFPSMAAPATNHQILARLPIRTFWTTNFDPATEVLCGLLVHDFVARAGATSSGIRKDNAVRQSLDHFDQSLLDQVGMHRDATCSPILDRPSLWPDQHNPDALLLDEILLPQLRGLANAGSRVVADPGQPTPGPLLVSRQQITEAARCRAQNYPCFGIRETALWTVALGSLDLNPRPVSRLVRTYRLLTAKPIRFRNAARYAY